MFGGRLRLITSGGAPIANHVMNFSRVVYGCLLFEGYGQTECSAAGTISLPFDTQGGHVGGPAVWAQVKLVDVDELGYKAENDIGEVCFRGAGLMNGYFNDDELTSKAVDDEGWLHTGDIGTWLPNGSLQIIDRKNNLFKLAHADFVSPEQIENVYSQHPLVKQIFVYGETLREYLIAIAVIDVNRFRDEFCKSDKHKELHAISTKTTKELLECREVRKEFLRELRRLGTKRSLNSIEQIRNIHLCDEELTIESGLLTPTLKLIRKNLKDKFADIIEQMYTEILDPSLS